MTTTAPPSAAVPGPPAAPLVTAAPRTESSHSGAAAIAHADAVLAGMERLAGLATEATGWTAEARIAMLGRLDRAVDGLAAVRAAVLVAERESGSWQAAGDRSFEAWRARTGRAAERSAAVQVRQAEQLATVPTAVAAVADGRIGMEHAVVIAKVAGAGTPAQQVAVSSPEEQERLVALAQRQDAGTFAVTVAQWASALDPDALEADHQAQRRERFLHLSDTLRGTFVRARLDTMAGHRLRLALEALSPRPAVDDDRDPGQRGADALDAMATRILALADTKPGGHVPPQVSLLVGAETWAGARAERDRRREAEVAGPAPSEPADRAGYPPATLEDGTPVPVSELAAVMCDCEITRIVVDAEGVPLDLGRTQRLFTREQRRAVIARDRECIWPGCHVHARWCEVHHVEWWERDTGPTSIDNGALLCSFHHHEVHRRDLTIRRRTVDATAASPPGRRSARRTPSTAPPDDLGNADTGEGRRAGEPASVPARARARTQGRARVAVAQVTYELRDRAGRVLGEPWRAPGRDGGHEVSGALELEWTTDPITGARTPTFLVPG